MEAGTRRRRIGNVLVATQFALIALCLLPVGPILFGSGSGSGAGEAGGAAGGPALIAGLVCLGLAAVLGGLAFLALGRDTRVNPVPHRDTHLHTNGIYAVIRHPMYTALLLGALGVTLVTGRLLSLLALIGLAGLLHLKSRFEDRLLFEQFGWQFAVYASHVPALVPQPWRRRR